VTRARTKPATVAGPDAKLRLDGRRAEAKPAAVLAIDGGGSKTDVALLSRDGDVLGAARAGGAETYDRTWATWGHVEERQLAPVHVAIEEAALRAGFRPEQRPLARVGSFCLAGADLPADDRRLLAWIRRNRWVDEPILRNDTFAVLRAGTDRPWGVAVVCGYGTNCAGVSPDGKITRFPAIGPISGDWGGGSQLGGEAAWYAVRSEDGRGPKTALQASVPSHFGFRNPRQLVEAIYFDRIGEDRLAELAPVVFAEAIAGDPIARGIVDRQADEIVVMATTAIKRLRMRRLDVQVVLGGGIFRTRDNVFYERIREGLTAFAPRSTIRRLAEPPLVGAALIGLDRIRATKAARDAIRAALTHDRLSNHTARRGRRP
jgi:N-acetylglucosamine kinase-like BadF-type ATPase